MNLLGLREFHRFEAAGQPFVYLVPSAAVFALDAVSDAVLGLLGAGDLPRDEVVTGLSGRFDSRAVSDTVAELLRVRAIGERIPDPPRPKLLPMIPLATMVLNVTNKCNLACTYCYEYGEDKIVDTENGRKPKFMSEATARDAVEFMLKESGSSPRAHLTFFGGETLLNFPVLKTTVAYARQRAAEMGKEVDFSMTTNATLLKPEIIEFLVENEVGVTISIDGPRRLDSARSASRRSPPRVAATMRSATAASIISSRSSTSWRGTFSRPPSRIVITRSRTSRRRLRRSTKG
jgi:uncharacterized protein